MSDNPLKLICTECDTHVAVYETPYSGSTDYVARCDCERAGFPVEVDVSEPMNESTLLEPFTGRWSKMEDDSRGA